MIAKASQAIFLNNYWQIIGNIFQQAISISNNKITMRGERLRNCFRSPLILFSFTVDNLHKYVARGMVRGEH